MNGGTCEDGIDEFSCICAEGFNGLSCEVVSNCLPSEDFCDSGICNVTVVNSTRVVTCQCFPGFTGDLCETDIDECEGISCGNGTCACQVFEVVYAVELHQNHLCMFCRQYQA